MNQTVFQASAQQNRGSGQFWPALLVVTLIISVVVLILSEGQRIVVGPGPLLVLILWRATRNKKETVRFFVNQHNSDFEFGYHDSANKLHGPYPVHEYTYWCHERSATMNGWNYDLYIQVNSSNSTVYLKQQIVARNPPPGWDRTPQQVKDGTGVFIVPDLVQLAALIDSGTPDEPASTLN